MQKKILITGATGRLGGKLIKELADNSAYSIIAVARDLNKVHSMFGRENINYSEKITAMSQDDFLEGACKEADAAVHMAFSRANMPYESIASSLDFAKNAFRSFKKANVQKAIYISSQAIYGSTSEYRSEKSKPAPDSVYAMAKYAGEKIFEEVFEGSDAKSSILRLDYVIQSQKLVPFLCRDAKGKGILNLQGGKQTFSYIDQRDVAKAIADLLSYEGSWKPVYNVGPNKMRCTLVEVAEAVKQVAEKHGQSNVEINLVKNDVELWSGMDSSLFMTDTGWKPSLNLFQMIESIYESV